MAADESFEAQRAHLLRLVSGLRAAIRTAVSLEARPETVETLADQACALARALAPFLGKRPFPLYSRDPTDLPFSPVTGPYNALSPETEIWIEGDGEKRVVARVRFSNVYEGPPGYVHGGWVAAMFDQTLAFANRANGVGGLTSSLDVRYRRPTPLNADVQFVAWVDRVENQKVFTRGECRLGIEVLAECEGIFVRVDAERARRIFGNQT
jgi:acyl-coenzyme A thioesterase PaaI-like protein